MPEARFENPILKGRLPALFFLAGIILLSRGFVSRVYSGNSTTSANFLQENLSSRQVGMGGMTAALPDGTGSIQSNPAGLALIRRPELNFSYAATRDFSRHAYTAYAHPLTIHRSLRLGFGAGLNYYTAGNIDINSSDGTTRSFNSENSYSGGISVSARIGEWIALGVSPKFVSSTLVEQFTGTAFAADAGMMVFPFRSGWLKKSIILGAAVQNIGTKINFRSADQDLPRRDSAGLSVRLFNHAQYGSILTSFQTERVIGERTRFRLGGEYLMNRGGESSQIFLRGGIRMHFQSEDFSIGIGIRQKNFQMDYAFVNGIELAKTHRVTLLFRFGSDPGSSDASRPKPDSSTYQIMDVQTEERKEEYYLHEESQREEEIRKKKNMQ